MGDRFLYNPKTNKLHILGYCQHAKTKRPDYIAFTSENEALAYDGRAVGFCKLCQQKREKEESENEEEINAKKTQLLGL